MRITVLMNGVKEEYLLGSEPGKGQRAMVVIPKGGIFAAENLDAGGYTFVSCVITPGFTYAGVRLVDKQEVREKYAEVYEEVKQLTY